MCACTAQQLQVSKLGCLTDILPHAAPPCVLIGEQLACAACVVVKGTLLPPHAAQVRQRPTRRLTVQTKKEGGFLMMISPSNGSNWLDDLLSSIPLGEPQLTRLLCRTTRLTRTWACSET